jgi:hypothetical protein
MIKAEPITILRFLSNYYDILRDLYQAQHDEGIIRREVLASVCEKYEHEVQNQLKEYKILRSTNEDFEMRDVYYKLFEFVFHEFKPMLPEKIEKFNLSINELFRKIKEGINGEPKILGERVRNLSDEIRSFLENIENNTTRLLQETRDLKANVEKIDYKEKVYKASHWIEHYILPLNRILDINYSESIASRLVGISDFSNQYRLNFSDENIRVQFEKLYNQLIQTNDDLLRQSKILTNELLPLIERIRTESLILTGWIEFLRNPYKVETPHLLKSNRGLPYSHTIFLNTKEFFEQFADEDEVVFEEEIPSMEKWIFNKNMYKAKLKEEGPVEDFFGWSAQLIREEYKVVDPDKFFSMAILLFEEDVNIEYSGKGEHSQIRSGEYLYKVPKIKVS